MREAACSVCGARESRKLFTAKDYNWLDSGSFDIVKCRRCGLVHLSPRPEARELSRYYPDLYYGGSDSGLSHKIGLIKRYFKPGSVLDIGCGRGFFLGRMKELGWDTRGVELSRGEAETAKQTFNIDVSTKDIAESGFLEGQFDLITLWHSLEHMEDPARILAQAYRFLKKGGSLVVSTPNVSSAQARLFGKMWYHIDAPRHLNLFSASTLKVLLERTRFSLKKVNYFVFDHNVYGWTMSALNTLKLNQGRLKKTKEASGRYRIPFMARAVKFLLFCLASPVAFIEGLLPIGGTIEAIAVKEGR